ncbi:hypothetical protein HHL16_05230 [Pseudoflavitalea sp. G-6-1-2]|uniref:hypothetical protein n=1 Tax=Pseudoflavitalea sp. G-6-1-2 TaxID=2728841 RepID=UPI00146AE678|nr:hypothetical protein [Pseudoflavitalea sp. G-6-1-2]NML20262.1 hypothetical protein [Pseudoflavitalea sp. G-6-1-2]
MKRIFFTVSIVALAGLAANAQESAGSTNSDPAFIRIMESAIQKLDTASSSTTLLQLGNDFERIGNAAKSAWQPFYYAAFCYTALALNTNDKSGVDAIAEKAAAFLIKAEALHPGNSEVSTVQAMLANARLLVDPPARYQELSVVAAAWLKKAHEQNPANPRPYLVEARTKLKTPAMLGGGAEAALPVLEEAVKKFKQFQPSGSIDPNWGSADAQKLLEQLKK